MKMSSKLAVSVTTVKAATVKTVVCGVALVAFCLLTAAHAEPSPAVCSNYADSYAQKQTRGLVLGGAVSGTAIGAGIGAIFGGAGAGAVVGVGLGTITGGNRKSQNYRTIYEDAFIDCMAGRVQRCKDVNRGAVE
jgi:uncharacterized membrane protein